MPQKIIPLTKKEKARIYRACELVNTDVDFFSCPAIANKFLPVDEGWFYLSQEYADFY